MSAAPRFLYFDLGNVLANFDTQRAIDNLAQQTELSGDAIRHELFTSGLQNRYETGELSSQAFVAELRQRLRIGPAASDRDLLDACSNMFWLNYHILPIVAQLGAAGHRVGILSNTCEAHWEWLTQGRYRLLNPRQYETCVLSYEIKSMKPAAGIYAEAIRRAGVPPQEIFFVDDRADNVAGARELGLDAVVFHHASQLVRDLAQRNILANF